MRAVIADSFYFVGLLRTMKKNMTMSDIRLRGHRALFAELGPVGFIRIVQQFVGRGDYTKDREKWLDKIDVSDFLARAKPAPSKPKRKVG